jgi:hypothetical protein
MKCLFLLVLWTLSWSVAAQEVYPLGCTALPVHDVSPNISNTQPMLLMLHNLSDIDLWVIRPGNGEGMQAGLSSLIQAGNWSALSINVNKNSLTLKCIESKPGHEQEVSCADALAICQWSKATFPERSSGVFWAGENMHLAPLQAFLARQGYVLQ